MAQVVQILAALMILGAFGGVQTGKLEPTAPSALTLNTIGGASLAALAFSDQQWGFVLLEGVWALIAAWGLARASQNAAASRRGRLPASNARRPQD